MGKGWNLGEFSVDGVGLSVDGHLLWRVGILGDLGLLWIVRRLRRLPGAGDLFWPRV